MDINKVKNIKGFEGIYSVDEYGEITNIKTGEVKSQYKCEKGYSRVNLWKGNKQKAMLVHRVVAIAFLGEPEHADQITVNHLDSDKSNNHYLNLAWATYQENEIHKRKFYGNDYHGAGNPTAKLDNIQVLTIRTFKINEIKKCTKPRNKLVREFIKLYQISQPTLNDIVNFKRYRNLPFLSEVANGH
jgi:hypothetical protein